MMRTQKREGCGTGKRLMAVFLSLVLTAGLLPVAAPRAAAAESSWLQPYLDKLVSWGVMRGDQAGNLDPDRPITRAEYVSLVNRAYGYDTTGKDPFSDVAASDWYYDDVCIASTAGYFSGTSDTTASPLSTLTREQAAVILGRNLMLQESPGESLNFTDSRSLSDWSRGLVKSAAQQGVVKGYPDGSFQPQKDITRGEVAVMLVNAIGTPLSQPGEYTLGSTYGNVTISSSGVTLRDTTIAGDLYITGGVGLGYVTLQNVTVLGKIIASGAGESNKGDNSIILRNVTAAQMIVDSPANQFVTVRADGNTKIDSTSVRTPSYLEDATSEDAGFTYIELAGEDGTSLELAGNIKEVMNLTPDSVLTVAKGSAQTVTMDESAPGSSVVVSSGAQIKTLNLDTATKVSGNGDVESLNVDASGSSTSMLPDTITIRPGLTANIAGETMDSVAGAESSEAPRILSGYPVASDLAPTSATIQFRTNKRGTIYWAVSSITDGSVGEEDLVNPPSYATKILKSGSVSAAASHTDYTAKVTGLTSDGSYYISAVLVDARNQRSPVKVAAFTTPDDSVPNFATGYPEMTEITNTSAQVAVMPTKTCKLYYAVLPKGSTAPTGADFKSSAVTGNLGFGSRDVVKNTVTLINPVNSRALDELASYDLYLWLTDSDGAKSSAVKKITFTTVDKTPPQFQTAPTVNSIKETSIGLVSSLNEAGTVYWVVVKEGETYPKPLAGSTAPVLLTSDTAKLQVASGMNALKSGKITATANKDLTITVSGLTAETAYDLYYVAQDKAGNYSASVEKITIHTLDTNPPSITQKFTRTSDSAGTIPMADTDIQIVFSESIQDTDGKLFMDLYQTSVDGSTAAERTQARDELDGLLEADIQLWNATDLPATLAEVRTDDSDDSWTVDYSKVLVSMDDGQTVFTFKSGENEALNLQSGSSYYFQIANIADTSNNKNYIRPNPQQLTEFQTAFAQINLKRTSQNTISAPLNDPDNPSSVTADMSFQMLPVSTSKVDDTVSWDMLIWSDSLVRFKLYEREKSTSDTSFGPWTYLGVADIPSTDGTYTGVSLSRAVVGQSGALTPDYRPLNELDENKVYEYAISVVSLSGESDRTAWSQEVNVQISLAAGGQNDLDNLANNVSPTSWTNALSDWDITSVGQPDPFTMVKKFSDSKAPEFTGVFPEFSTGDSSVKMSLMLDRAGTVYYVVAPVSYTESPKSITYSLNTTDLSGADVYPDIVPTSGQDTTPVPDLSLPLYTTVVKPSFGTDLIKSGSKSYGGSGSLLDISVTDLEPETLYYVYFVLKGSSTSSPFSQILCYQFTTEEVTRPVITLDINNPSVNVTVDSDAEVDYLLAVNDQEGSAFKETMLSNVLDQTAFQTNYPSTYSDMTVLDAMSTDVRDAATGKSVGSVFDVYASAEAKDQFANLIRNQSVNSSTIVMKGQQTFLASNPMTSVDCKNYMGGTTWYTFLAVGKSILDSGDAFRAIRPVFLRDTTPPLVTTCTVSPSEFTSPSFTGILTVVFNEDLYFKEINSGTTTQTINPVAAVSTLNPTSEFVSLIPTAIQAIDPSISLHSEKPEEKIFSIQFDLDGATSGASIVFDPNLCDESGNTRDSTPLTLILKYDTGTDISGNTIYLPYFAITNSWDATESN